ncbi:hypothetical protein BHE74_00007052 [Ensete ventricosum]|nr:hypothetical protein BHE74_00007052 [Ensete ventricosum]
MATVAVDVKPSLPAPPATSSPPRLSLATRTTSCCAPGGGEADPVRVPRHWHTRTTPPSDPPPAPTTASGSSAPSTASSSNHRPPSPSNATPMPFVDVLPPEAESSISLLNQSEKPLCLD